MPCPAICLVNPFLRRNLARVRERGGARARSPARSNFRKYELLAVSFDRQGEPEPSQHRAAIPHVASSFPVEQPRGGISRGHHDRSPNYAGV
jgi:hypothetical protein